MTPDPFMAAIAPLLRRHRNTASRQESLELLKAVRLAPRLEVAEALLRGERVPRSSLDEQWLRAYGL